MKKRVLIADDDRDLLDLLTFRCVNLGFEVCSASNALAAIGSLERFKPDLAILDVQMPSGSGLAVRELISTHQDLCSIPVIILTGQFSEETVKRCHEQCSYYIPKCPDVWSRLEPLLAELFPRADSPLTMQLSYTNHPNLPVARLTAHQMQCSIF